MRERQRVVRDQAPVEGFLVARVGLRARLRARGIPDDFLFIRDQCIEVQQVGLQPKIDVWDFAVELRLQAARNRAPSMSA